jgi:tetratricopeptide (TPR) repeat protein
MRPLLAAFILSLLSKMMAAPLALVLPALDYLMGRTFSRHVWLEKIPFVAAALILGIFELSAHKEIGSMLGDISYGPWGRIVLASYALAGYLEKLILPINLSAYYPFPFPPGNIPGTAVLYVIGCLALLAGTVYSLRFSRKIFFGATFFILNVAVILQFVPAIGAFMADRYTYIVSIGIFYLAGEGANALMMRSLMQRKLVAGTAVLAVLLFASGSWSRAGVWKDETLLWGNVLEMYPEVAFVYVYRANARIMPSEYDAAMSDIARALELEPDLGIGYYSRAYLESLHGDHNAAIGDYGRAIELKYKPVNAYSNRGSSYASLGKYREAANDYSSAIQLDPGYSDAYFNRGNIFLTTGEFSEAEKDYGKSLELNPADGESYYNRGMARSRLGNAMGACDDFRRAEGLGFPRARAAVAEFCR